MKKYLIISSMMFLIIINIKGQAIIDTISIVKYQNNTYTLPKFKYGDSTLIITLINELSSCLDLINANDSLERFIDFDFEIGRKGYINKRKFVIHCSKIFESQLDKKKNKLLKQLCSWIPATTNGKNSISIVTISVWIKKRIISILVKDNFTRKEIIKYTCCT